MAAVEPRYGTTAGALPPNVSTIEDQSREYLRCAKSPLYFLEHYGYVLNINEEAWIPFALWPAQRWALVEMNHHDRVVVLKARQLGLSWLALGYALWLMLFRPAAAVGIFSRIETDAQELLDFRIKGMYDRLPAFLMVRAVLENNKSRWVLSNGSFAMAFATTGGRQYTFSLVLVDEADFQPDLPALMAAAKPTVDAGGRMFLLSSSDKSAPESRFKQIYRAAKKGDSDWLAIFLPWHARPSRTEAWYEAQKREAIANTGALDDFNAEYPATDTEALAPRTLDKRIPGPWLEDCRVDSPRLWAADAPALEGLEVYELPQPEAEYVIGADPAEGNPNSDDSALAVLNVATGNEAAALAGKYEPTVFAAHADAIGKWYNHAAIMPERNNHGHAVIAWLNDNSRMRILNGHDGRPGWLSSSKGKALLYSETADAFRIGDTELHSFATFTQLASIEGSTLRAPDGQHDDRADSYALAIVGMLTKAPVMSSAQIDLYGQPAQQGTAPKPARTEAEIEALLSEGDYA